jgi:hypothetical protein
MFIFTIYADFLQEGKGISESWHLNELAVSAHRWKF